MNRDNANVVAGLVDRITKLEITILELEKLAEKERFTLIGLDHNHNINIELNVGEIATVVFKEDIIKLYISTLNLELDELVKSLEEY